MVAPLSDQSVGCGCQHGDDLESRIAANGVSTVGVHHRCQRLPADAGSVWDRDGRTRLSPEPTGEDVLDEIQGFDPQTLTEDFDITVKVLRAGYEVRSSEARVYTEAPDTLRDLYNQRLRWYRGNYMTIFKHRGILSEPTTGFLYRFAFPLRLIELLFLPFASWVILGLIVKILLSGFVIQVVSLFVFFLSIIFLIAALGVYIEGEDWRLLWYTPLF